MDELESWVLLTGQAREVCGSPPHLTKSGPLKLHATKTAHFGRRGGSFFFLARERAKFAFSLAGAPQGGGLVISQWFCCRRQGVISLGCGEK